MGFPSTSILDTAQRPNEGPPPSSSWGTTLGDTRIIGNGIGSGAAGTNIAYWLSAFGAAQEVFAEIGAVPVLGESMLLLSNMVNPSNIAAVNCHGLFYDWRATGGKLYFTKTDTGAVTSLVGAEISVDLAVGDTVGYAIIPSASLALIFLQRAGKQMDLLAIRQATYVSAGNVGVGFVGTSARWKNFRAGTSVASSSQRALLSDGSFVANLSVSSAAPFNAANDYVIEFGLLAPRLAYGTTQYILDGPQCRFRFDPNSFYLTYFSWQGTAGNSVYLDYRGKDTVRLSRKGGTSITTFEVFHSLTGAYAKGELPVTTGAKALDGEWRIYGATYGNPDILQQSAGMRFLRARCSTGAATLNVDDVIGTIPGDYSAETWNVFDLRFTDSLEDSSGNDFDLSVVSGTARYVNSLRIKPLIHTGGDFGIDDFGQTNQGFGDYTLAPGVAKQLDFRKTLGNNGAKTYLLEKIAGTTSLTIQNATSAQPAVTAGTPTGDREQLTVRLTVSDGVETSIRIFHLGVVKRDQFDNCIISDAGVFKMVGEMQAYGSLATMDAAQSRVYYEAKKKQVCDWAYKVPYVPPYGGRPGGLDPFAVIPGTISVTNGSPYFTYSGNDLGNWIENPNSDCTVNGYKGNINVEEGAGQIYKKIRWMNDTGGMFTEPWNGTTGTGRNFYTAATEGQDIQAHYRYRFALQCYELYLQTGLEIYLELFNRITLSLWRTYQWFYGIPVQGERSPAYQDDAYSLILRAYLDKPEWEDFIYSWSFDRINIRVHPYTTAGAWPGPKLPSGLDLREMTWMTQWFYYAAMMRRTTFSRYGNGTHLPATETGLTFSSSQRATDLAKADVDILNGLYARLQYSDGSWRYDADGIYYGITSSFMMGLTMTFFMDVHQHSTNAASRATALELLGDSITLLRNVYVTHSAGAAFGGITWRAFNYLFRGTYEDPPGTVLWDYTAQAGQLGDAQELYQGDNSVRLNRYHQQLMLAAIAYYSREAQDQVVRDFFFELLGSNIGDSVDQIKQTAFIDERTGTQKMVAEAFYNSNRGIAIAAEPLGVDTQPNITTTTLPGVIQNEAYSQTLQVTGGESPLVWDVSSGSLPSGITLSSAGILSGTPTVSGTFNFTARVTDLDGDFDTQALSLVVAADTTPNITTTSLSSATNGAAYSQTLQVSGGNAPLSWNVSAGSLPSGLTLSSSGVLSGTPTATGTFNFTARVVDVDGDVDTQALSLVVNPPDTEPTITTTSLPQATVGVAYNQTLQVSSGNSPFTWDISSGGLPAGLTLSSAGVLGGTPTASGTFNFTARVTDVDGDVDTQALSLIVNVAGDTTPPTVALTAPAAGAVVSGQIVVSATANDNVAVVGVRFRVDGVNVGAEDTTDPYSVSLDTTTLSDGTHTITAVARDAAGNTTTSAPRAIIVDNTRPGFASASIGANGQDFEINFTETGSSPLLPITNPTGLTLVVSGISYTLGNLTRKLNGLGYTGTLDSVVYVGQVATVRATGSNISDTALNYLLDFTNQPVTNNSTQTQQPGGPQGPPRAAMQRFVLSGGFRPRYLTS